MTRQDITRQPAPRHAGRARRRGTQPVWRELRGAVPDQQLRAARCRDRGAPLCRHEEGYTYARTSNPTVTSIEQRLAALEGTEAAIGASSGMGAILLMCMGLLKAGDHVMCSQSVFGSTLNLFGKEFAKFGVETTFVSQTDVAQWQAAMRPNTKLLFAETPDQPADRGLRHPGAGRRGARGRRLLAVDNCFCSPALQQPAELGADLVIHSGTKYLDGQGRVMAGAMCGPQKLIVEKFVPDRAHRRHGAGAVQCLGRAQGHGNAAHPHAGAKRQRAGAGAVAGSAAGGDARLLPRPASHPQHALAMRQQSGLGGAVVSFDVRGGDPANGARQRLPRDRQHAGVSASPPIWATPKPPSPTRPAPRTAASPKRSARPPASARA